MSQHAFVDESARGQYLLCAAIVSTRNLDQARSTMRSLQQSSRRVHMAHERDRRRRLILSTIAEAGMQANLYVASSAGRSQRAARDDCLRALVPDMIEIGVTRVVIESCDQDKHDRQTIVDTLAKTDTATGLSYVHLPPAGDPILWAADAVVWAWGRGGDWRRRTDNVVKVVRRCGI